jgi:pimeloyl-ACP methyl ester carboxylesterase
MFRKNDWIRILLLLTIGASFSACGPRVEPTSTALVPSAAPASSVKSNQTSESTLTVQPTTEATADATLAATTIRNFDVNGHSLSIKCLGSGSPTIVLETGEGGTRFDVADLQERLATRAMTCAYDRARTGGLRTAQDVVNDLHDLLAAAEVPGPYLLVGHSAGGMFVQLYAQTFPDQVAGVIAMNPVPPAHPWLDQVSKVFTPEEYAEEEAYYQGQNGESFDYLASSEQINRAPKPPQVPFEMLISTNVQCENDTGPCMKSYSNYEKIMQEITATWPHGSFSQVAAGHEIYLDQPDAVLAIVEKVVSSQ